MHWKDIPIHIIDFEGSQSSGVIEFGVVTLQYGTVTQAITDLCCAVGDISQRDYEQHGISFSDTVKSPPFSAHWETFSGFRKTGPLAAHYAHVENKFIKSVWPHPGQCPDFISGGTMAEWGPWLDSCRIFVNQPENLDSYKLGDLVKFFNLEEKLNAWVLEYCPPDRQKWHCALYDALASALLFCDYCERLGAPYDTIEALLTASASNPKARETLIQDELF